MSQSVERFSSRVENYVKYRPGYPAEILNLLKTACGLTLESTTADLGSGTGKLAELFLKQGYSVIGVEPNAGMRAAAERILSAYSNFQSVNGTAETTTLPNSSIDLITAGQAFHWFDQRLTRIEATRILKPGGCVALIWNDRKLATTPFLRDYEALLLKHGSDYQEVRHDRAEGEIAKFFDRDQITLKIFPNEQVFDLDGLRGRVLSSSYTPEPAHPSFQPMMDELEVLFEKHQNNGSVVLDYDTKVYYGRLSR